MESLPKLNPPAEVFVISPAFFYVFLIDEWDYRMSYKQRNELSDEEIEEIENEIKRKVKTDEPLTRQETHLFWENSSKYN